jgi:hypothetical protein
MPLPHETLVVVASASFVFVEPLDLPQAAEHRFVRGRCNARDGANLRMTDAPGAKLRIDQRQFAERARHAHLLARRTRAEADAPTQPMRARLRPLLRPALALVEATNSAEQLVHRRVGGCHRGGDRDPRGLEADARVNSVTGRSSRTRFFVPPGCAVRCFQRDTSVSRPARAPTDGKSVIAGGCARTRLGLGPLPWLRRPSCGRRAPCRPRAGPGAAAG